MARLVQLKCMICEHPFNGPILGPCPECGFSFTERSTDPYQLAEFARKAKDPSVKKTYEDLAESHGYSWEPEPDTTTDGEELDDVKEARPAYQWLYGAGTLFAILGLLGLLLFSAMHLQLSALFIFALGLICLVLGYRLHPEAFQKLFPKIYARSPHRWKGWDAYYRLHHAIDTDNQELLMKIAHPSGYHPHRVDAINHIKDQKFLMQLFVSERELIMVNLVARVIQDQSVVLAQMKAWHWTRVRSLFSKMPYYKVNDVCAEKIPTDAPKVGLDDLVDVLGVKGFISCSSYSDEWTENTLDYQNGFNITLFGETSGTEPNMIYTVEQRIVCRLSKDVFTYIDRTIVKDNNPGDRDWEYS